MTQVISTVTKNKTRMLLPDGLRESHPCPWMDLAQYVVARTSTAPTLTVSCVGEDGELRAPRTLTPYRLMGRFGIRSVQSFQGRDRNGPEAIDSAYSVHSYLWAMRYLGFMPIIAKWPGNHFPKAGPKGQFGYLWDGSLYRPEYAFVAILDLMGGERRLVRDYTTFLNSVPTRLRLPLVRRSAEHFLQEPVDSYAARGFYELYDRSVSLVT